MSSSWTTSRTCARFTSWPWCARATTCRVSETLRKPGRLATAQRFDVVITDMRLPDGMGISLLQRLRDSQRRERCVVITAYGSADNAVESLKAGAFDYLTKPVDIQQFRAVIASAVQGARKEAVAGRRHNAGNASREGFNRRRTDTEPGMGEAALQRLVGESSVMRQVKERVAKVARSMAPVLVTGESGTGKELVARALHANSHRSAGPMVAVNCSAIPEQLLESEFFGTRKGAFTGATQDRDGFFQAARGGSLFLDEIGDLPLAMQSKLLRAIQERSVRSVGSTQEEPVDVRIISATHRDLAADVQSGRFRQDLYYRLNVIDIVIPPLRDRLDDLPALCQSLLARIAQEAGMPVPALSASVLEQICLAPLKGNVRELENLLHRAVALSEGGDLQVDSWANRPCRRRCAGTRCRQSRRASGRRSRGRFHDRGSRWLFRAICRVIWTVRSGKSWCRPCTRPVSIAPPRQRAWV